MIRNVVVGISGGVDSAVAALLLKKKGYNVIGAFMKNWDSIDEDGICTGVEDLDDAKYVCGKLQIPLYEVDFVKEYWNEVFVGFLNEYQLGQTPNPDILCNKFIKFKAFLNHAISNLQGDAIATGHYARNSLGNYLERYESDKKAKLLKAEDINKDQTFFLSQVPQKALKRTMFPLGDLTKDLVRKIAEENGLEKVAKKPDSTGICFIGSRNFRKFISDYIPPKPGKFIDLETGKIAGTHDGIHLWTLGQRTPVTHRNVGYYVTQKNPATSDILIAPGLNHPAHFSSLFFTNEPHWIADPPDLSYIEEFDFKFRHAKRFMKCDLLDLGSGELLGVTKSPFRAMTPGQFAVFYKNNECLGSAKITKIGPSLFSLGKTVPDSFDERDEVCAVSNN